MSASTSTASAAPARAPTVAFGRRNVSEAETGAGESATRTTPRRLLQGDEHAGRRARTEPVVRRQRMAIGARTAQETRRPSADEAMCPGFRNRAAGAGCDRTIRAKNRTDRDRIGPGNDHSDPNVILVVERWRDRRTCATMMWCVRSLCIVPRLASNTTPSSWRRWSLRGEPAQSSAAIESRLNRQCLYPASVIDERNVLRDPVSPQPRRARRRCAVSGTPDLVRGWELSLACPRPGQ